MGQPALSLSAPFPIVGASVLSSVGVGLRELAESIEARRHGRTSTTGLFESAVPVDEVCALRGFSARQHLGAKGTAFMDRTTAMVMVACGMALESAGLEIDDGNRRRVGLVIGTSTGSARAISEYARESLVQARPYLVNPLVFPNTVMNCAAGQSAIRYGLKGVNATVSGGQLSGLLALRYAMSLLRRGRSEALVVGAVEELSPQTVWGWHHAGRLREGHAALGEACATVVLAAPGTSRGAALAELAACEVGTSGPGESVGDRLAECVATALRAAGAEPAQVGTVAGSFRGDLLDEEELSGLRAALGAAPEPLCIKELAGECYSAAGALQLVAALAARSRKPISLVTSVDHSGAVGCAVVRAP